MFWGKTISMILEIRNWRARRTESDETDGGRLLLANQSIKRFGINQANLMCSSACPSHISLQQFPQVWVEAGVSWPWDPPHVAAQSWPVVAGGQQKELSHLRRRASQRVLQMNGGIRWATQS